VAAQPAWQPGGREPAPGELALIQAFVNTEIPEWHRDDVGTPDALAGWLATHGLLEHGVGATAEEFVRARAVREALRELALANTLDGPLDGAVRARVDALLRQVPLVLESGPDGGVGVRAAGSGVDVALGRLLAIVLEAERDGVWRRLKACRQDTCKWLFYDHSRNRSSSWCSMSICGNRVKTRAYRRRRAAGEETE
jgi:predicted RNA-binding Zn ribbon-like protein